MSLAERRLPQYCCLWRHKHSFKAEQGKFLDNFSRFACFECLRKRRRKHVIKEAAKVSTAEYELCQELHRSGVKFRHHFKLGRWEFDFAFPDLNILLEIDGPAHEYRYQQRVDCVKDGVARDEGWTMVRVVSGPGLIQRVSTALSLRS